MSKPLKVLITDSAKDDINTVFDYIAIDNKTAAINIIDTFYKVFELLSDYPETGTLKNDLADKTVRIYSIKKNFVIAYRIRDNKIEILRILTRYQNIFAVLN